MEKPTGLHPDTKQRLVPSLARGDSTGPLMQPSDLLRMRQKATNRPPPFIRNDSVGQVSQPKAMIRNQLKTSLDGVQEHQ